MIQTTTTKAGDAIVSRHQFRTSGAMRGLPKVITYGQLPTEHKAWLMVNSDRVDFVVYS